ncbi:hypothetical protein D3C87_847310 [compost metagenome]
MLAAGKQPQTLLAEGDDLGIAALTKQGEALILADTREAEAVGISRQGLQAFLVAFHGLRVLALQVEDAAHPPQGLRPRRRGRLQGEGRFQVLEGRVVLTRRREDLSQRKQDVDRGRGGRIGRRRLDQCEALRETAQGLIVGKVAVGLLAGEIQVAERLRRNVSQLEVACEHARVVGRQMLKRVFNPLADAAV